MKLIAFLLFLTCFQTCFACYQVFNNVTKYYGNSHYHRRLYGVSVINTTITCSNIYSISEIFYQYEDQSYDQFLKITESNITTLHPNELSQFTTIRILHLTGIYIKEILPGAFTGLQALEELYLDQNELTEISKGVFTSLQKLKVLDLSYNKIVRMERYALMGVSSLQQLHFRGNNLSKVEDDAFDKLWQLECLDLSGNPIETVAIGDLSNLDFLFLNKTLFTHFGDVVNVTMTLEVLNLTSSGIKSVDFSKFPKVQTLDLSDNSIKSVENCQNLSASKVFLANNQIKSIKTGFNKLTQLDLSYNHLETINQSLFINSQSIFVADFSSNNISTIEPDAFKNLSKLEELHLDNNNITSLEVGLFDDLTSLVSLTLSFNSIDKTKFGIFNTLKSLKFLDISHNKIMELHPFNFYSLSKLTYLDLSYNQISSFDVKDLTTHLPSLLSISLDGNFWKCKQLAQMDHLLKNMSVVVKEGDSYDIENFKGIACQNDNLVSENTTNTSTKVLFEEFQKLMNASVENSEFQRFLNEDFKNSSFVKFFEEFKRSTVTEETKLETSVNEKVEVAEIKTDAKIESGTSGILVLGFVLQIIMCFLLICIAYLMLQFLKKLEVKNQNQNYSEVELCTNEI